MPKEENVRTTVIIPESDYNYMVAIANRDQRSISGQAYHFIKKGLNADRIINPDDE